MQLPDCRIGGGGAFWGDIVDPAVELVEHGNLDYLGFDLLAELTMSILARSRDRNPDAGFIPDLPGIARQLLPAAVANDVKLTTNGGGANPIAGGRAVADVAVELGFADLSIAVLDGDELTDRIAAIRGDGWKFTNLETGEEDIDEIADRVVAAHAYTGSEGIIEALGQGAQMVIGGRLTDSALFSGPLMHHFGWNFEDPDWDLIGSALTVGHILECGACSSGGMSSQWRDTKDPWKIGFPLAQVASDGTATIEKVEGSGGLINQWTIKEHLLYEVHDPFSYLLPDAEVDMGNVEIREIGQDQVRVTGMTSKPRPDTLKVQIGYEDGFIAESRALISWPDALEKADWCERLIRERLRYIGVEPLEQRYDRIGVNAVAGPIEAKPEHDPSEIEFRMAIKTRTREEAEAARRSLVIAATIGPVGTAFAAPSPVRRVIGLWPTLVPRELIEQTVTVMSAKDLASAAS